MARYDSPDFRPETFGLGAAFGNGRDGAQTAPGSDGTVAQEEAPEASYVLGDPIISAPHASSQVPADMPRASVPASQTQVLGQVPEREPFSGVENTFRSSFPGPGSPSDHVATPHHPNALPIR